MRKILLVIAFCMGAVSLQAQTTDEDVFTVVEQMPEFPGGDDAFKKFLSDNLTYPEMAKEQGIYGKVWVSFTVDKEGNIKDPKVIRGIGGGCDEEAIRVIKKMPKWLPGKQAGRAVSTMFRLPINFVLK